MTNFSVPSWTYLHDLSSHEDMYLQIIRRVLASGRLRWVQSLPHSNPNLLVILVLHLVLVVIMLQTAYFLP